MGNMPLLHEVNRVEFKQIRRRKIYEEVAEQIQDLIRDGSLKPGDRLASVRELAEQFEVGRSAVREALSALRAMGLLEMRQGEGTFVRSFDARSLSGPIASAVLMNQKQILELVEVRKVVETGTAGICAERRDEKDLSEMKTALTTMEACLGDSEELAKQADLRFHFAIARGTKNGLLMDMMNRISDVMKESMRESRRIWLFAQAATAERLLREHQSIYEAIRDRDPILAQQRMESHLGKVEEALRPLNKNQVETADRK